MGSNVGFICTAITEILPLPKILDHRQTLRLFIVDGLKILPLKLGQNQVSNSWDIPDMYMVCFKARQHF